MSQTNKSKNNVALLGADKFILALEHHDKNELSSGNTCHYKFDLEGEFNVSNFQELLLNNNLFQWLSRFQLGSKWNNSNTWKLKEEKDIKISEIESDEEFPNEVITLKTCPRKEQLIQFTLVHRSCGKQSLFFSWHHLLMDAYGATLLLKNLYAPASISESKRNKSKISWPIFKASVLAKKYVSTSANGSIPIHSNDAKFSKQIIHTIAFNQSESLKIESNMQEFGVGLSKSHYALASSSIVIQNFFEANQSGSFWVPIPQDNRRKGSKWPIVGNNLSFVFYRIPLNINSKKELINELNQQLYNQARQEISKGYTHLSNFMRRIPSTLYARLIKGPSGKSLSSFLFTNAPDFPEAFNNINGCKVKNISCIPPNLTKPGLTISTSRFNNQLQLVISTYEHILDMDKLMEFEQQLREEILHPKVSV